MTFTKIVNTGIGTLVHSFAVPKGLTSERPIGISSGQIRYNTDLHIFEGYHNNVWQSLSSASAEQIYKETFNVVNAQSSFTLSTGQFDNGFIDVYVNGIRLPREDYSEFPPNRFVLDVEAVSGDTVEIVAFRTRAVNTDIEADLTNLNVSGIVTGGQFYGDGRNLTNIPVGIGTALDPNVDVLDSVFYVNNILGISSTVTVDAPAGTDKTTYTHHSEIVVDNNNDFIVGEDDDFVLDIFGIGDLDVADIPGSGGRVRANNYVAKTPGESPTFPDGLNAVGITSIQNTKTLGSSAFLQSVIAIEDIVNVDETVTLTSPYSGGSVLGTANKIVAVSDSQILTIGENEEFVINLHQV